MDGETIAAPLMDSSALKALRLGKAAGAMAAASGFCGVFSGFVLLFEDV